ncbi:hypothetical protein O181_074171 [Austropuccinia psidii MF-1]|uniref:Uncharacterized protein n=1 Tax=Austropuccinia psidii MF-1 TaxID=1389203 RepID=A0A9Q3FCF7_9BASI|nr:hypothetical protein [Austropuccinia psidii MF-1]
MSKDFEVGHELLFTHQELSRSVEDHRGLRRLEPHVFKDKVKNMKNLFKNQNILSVEQRKELKMTPDLEKEGLVASANSKPVPELPKDKPKGPQRKEKGPRNKKERGKGKANENRPYPQGYRIPQLQSSDVDIMLNMANSFMELTAK